MKLLLPICLLVSVCALCECQGRGRGRGNQIGSNGNSGQRGKPTTPPGLLKKELGSKRVKVGNGRKELQFFAESAITELQAARRELLLCLSKPGQEDRVPAVDDIEFVVGDVLVDRDDINQQLEDCKAMRYGSDIGAGDTKGNRGRGVGKVRNRGNGRGDRNKRQILPEGHWRLWTDTDIIPIVLTDHAASKSDVVQVVDEMIADFNMKSCVRMQRRTSPPNEPYILIVTELNSGCFTSHGRYPSFEYSYVPAAHRDIYATPVFVDYYGGCNDPDTIRHEVMHNLGFDHEQSRSDRDHHIELHRERIVYYLQNQFDQCTDCDSRNTPYDYTSVMHYRAWDGSSNGEPTMVPKPNANLIGLLGAAKDLSPLEWRRVNLAYCKDKCVYQRLPCTGGYQNPNDCSQCICPTGIGAGRCDGSTTLPRDFYRCGQVLDATSYWQSFTIEQKKQHPSPNECVYILQAPANHVVVLDTTDTSVSSGSYGRKCLYGHIEIRTDDFETGVEPRCDAMSNVAGQFQSVGRQIMIVARNSYNYPETSAKFKYIVDPYITGTSTLPAPVSTTETWQPFTNIEQCDARGYYYKCVAGVSNWGYMMDGIVQYRQPCIPRSWWCDGMDDCSDGSDELTNEHGYPCPHKY